MMVLPQRLVTSEGSSTLSNRKQHLVVALVSFMVGWCSCAMHKSWEAVRDTAGVPSDIIIKNAEEEASLLPVERDSSLSDNGEQEQQRSAHRVIVLSTQCSGSTWFCDALGKLEEPVSFSENTENLVNYSLITQEEWNAVEWSQYKNDIENSFPVGSGQSKRVGIKLMYDQIPPSVYKDLAKWLNENHDTVSVIHLRRAGIMQAVCSLQRGVRVAALGSDHFWKRKSDSEQIKMTEANYTAPVFALASANFYQRLDQNQEEFAHFLRVHASLVPQFEVSYEDMDGPNFIHVSNAIAGFLMDTTTSLRMGTYDNASDLVKSGSRICEDRLQGMGDQYESLVPGYSKLICTSLHTLYGGDDGSLENFYPRKQENRECWKAVPTEDCH